MKSHRSGDVFASGKVENDRSSIQKYRNLREAKDVCIREAQTLIVCPQNILKIAAELQLQASHDLENVLLADDNNWAHGFVL